MMSCRVDPTLYFTPQAFETQDLDRTRESAYALRRLYARTEFNIVCVKNTAFKSDSPPVDTLNIEQPFLIRPLNALDPRAAYRSRNHSWYVPPA